VKTIILAAIALLCLALPSPGECNSLLEDIIVESAVRVGVDPDFAIAIAKVESDMDPFVVGCTVPRTNADVIVEAFGDDVEIIDEFSGISRIAFKVETEKKQRILDELIGTNWNCDFGVFQVNTWWIRKLDLKPSFVMKPEVNVALGLLVIKHNLELFENDHARGIEAYFRGAEEAKKAERLEYFSKVMRVIGDRRRE